LLWLALLLWPLDIALRRLRLRRSDLAAAAAAVRQWVRLKPARQQPAADAPDATIARLHSARTRARRKSERGNE
jgi:hypothetical protein